MGCDWLCCFVAELFGRLYTNTPPDAFNSRVHMLTDPGLGVEKLAEYRKPDACVTASVKLQVSANCMCSCMQLRA